MSERPDDVMFPEATPWKVRRLNNGPLYIVLGVAVLFVGALMMVAVGRARQADAIEVGTEDAPMRRAEDSTAKLANSVIGSRTSGIIPAARTKPSATTEQFEASEQDEVVPIASVDLDQPPRPPRRGEGASVAPAAASVEDEVTNERKEALRRALAGSTRVEMENARPSMTAAATTRDLLARMDKPRLPDLPILDPSAAYQRALDLAEGAAARQHLAVEGATAVPKPASTEAAPGDAKDRFRLDSTLEAPRSPFLVQAGAVIPATLVSAVNSELPGPIIAQTAQAVYDSPTGKHLLIPQGAKLFGEYSVRISPMAISRFGR